MQQHAHYGFTKTHLVRKAKIRRDIRPRQLPIRGYRNFWQRVR